MLRIGILKNHGNGQFGGSFERCVRCVFVVSVVLHECGYAPSPLKIDTTYKNTEKKTEKHDFYRIFIRAITL